jgi:methylglutamate dehydrogenase subunit C
MSRRLASGGCIDRARSIAFSFDGRRLTGFVGDTLASALLANDLILVGRSFKYHRPRGIFTAGPEEPNALVTLGDGAWREPNIAATTVELHEGLVAESQNRWPSLSLDIQAMTALAAPLLPAGFYYKTFMGPTPRAWEIYEPWIRRAAGLGRASEAADPDRYDTRHAFCDVAVVGAGPAGCATALSAARAGARVVLIEQNFQPGGQLLAAPAGGAGNRWLAETAAEMKTLPKLRLMIRTTAFGVYDGGTLGLVERHVQALAHPAKGIARQSLVLLRSRAIVFATGAIERPLLFPDNDRPGIMLASAARSYLHRFGVRAGDKTVVATDNDSAYQTAIDLAKAGAEVRLTDLRPTAPLALAAAARASGVEVVAGAIILGTRGRRRIRSIEITGSEDRKQNLACDLLCVSGGWSPTTHLTSHLGLRPSYLPEIGAFVADGLPAGQFAAGAVAGRFDTAGAIAEGARAGASAAASCGFTLRGVAVPPLGTSVAEPAEARANPQHRSPILGKAFVDLQNDVTVADISLAHREGYGAVEHLKRYTTLGMGTDQGKTSNLAGLEVMAETSKAPPATLGATTFRPPYTPVTIGALAGRSVGQHFRPIRRTPLHDWHLQNGAEMIEVGLWLRPWFYRSNGADANEAYVREMRAVREAAGLIDISTLGKIEVHGPDAIGFLERVYANNLASLRVGGARYAVMLRDDGIVFDDGTVTRIAENRFFLTTSTAKASDVTSWLEFLLDTAWTDLDVHVTSVTEEWAAISLAGPESRYVLAEAFPGANISDAALPHMGVLETQEDSSPVRILRLSYSGERAFEIYVAARQGRVIWRRLMAAGSPRGLRPYGVEALGALRVEKGHVAGPEIDGRTTLTDLGLERLESRKKLHVGVVLAKRPALREDARPKLVGLECHESDKRLRAGAILFAPGDAVRGHGRGRVTSVTWSSTLGRYVGLGFYEGGLAHAGQDVFAHYPIRNESVRARIVSPVFLDPAGERLHG